jgi:hypothetical protein
MSGPARWVTPTSGSVRRPKADHSPSK